MSFDPEKHHRRSVRLKGYDYAQVGAYFVTICTYQRECLFGEVVEGEMRVNSHGAIVQRCWSDLPRHYPYVELDAFAVMPNHVHGIVVLTGFPILANVGAGLRPAPTSASRPHPLSEIVRAFKSFSSRHVNRLRNTPGLPLWQRNYYEHVIRDEQELHTLRQYVADNPLQWALDQENPARVTIANKLNASRVLPRQERLRSCKQG